MEGSNDGAVLLGGAAEQAFVEGLVRLGVLCSGCGALVGQGWEYVGLMPQMIEGRPHVRFMRTYVCNEPSCEEHRKLVGSEAAARRPITAAWELVEEEEAPVEAG